MCSSSHRKTKNRLINYVRTAAGNSGDGSEGASHAINNLETNYSREFKNCLVYRGYATNSVKKIKPVEVLPMMDEVNVTSILISTIKCSKQNNKIHMVQQCYKPLTK